MRLTDSVTTLVFDVLGTVLDEDGTRAAALGPADPEIHARWPARVEAAIADVVAGSAPYRPPVALYRETLAELLPSTSVERIDELARFGYRLEPFPDTVPAFERLARGKALVALTNAGRAQAFAMSAHSGLRWTTLLSGESVGAYKPDPRVYRHAIDTLELEPGRSLFVAAHDWDLDAAARHGFRTCYVDRSGAGPDELAAYAGRFDLVVTDLAGLADALGL